MTTVLPMITETEVTEATPGCGCCVPPPDASAPTQLLAALQERKERLERRLMGLSPRS